MSDSFGLKRHLQSAAQKLRSLEYERARGNTPLLEQIEHTPDSAILKKWGFIGSFVAALFSFVALPFLIGILQPFIPEFFDQILWLIAKISMGMSLLMFGATIYFTIGLDAN